MYTPDYVLGRLVVRVIADATHYHRTMAGVQTHLGALVGAVSKFGRDMAAAFTLPLGVIGAASVRAFAGFDKAMTQAMAIVGSDSRALRREMESTALEIAGRSITAPYDLADAYTSMTQAGLTATQSQAMLGAVERFAVAGMMSMGVATNHVIKTQLALGMSSDNMTEHLANATRIMDVMTLAGNLTSTTTERISEAMNRAAPGIQLYGLSIEEGAAALGIYARYQLEGVTAGELLTRSLRELGRASLRNTTVWNELLGPNAVFNQQGERQPLEAILGRLAARMEDLSDQERELLLMRLKLQDRTGIRGLLPLITSHEEFRGLIDTLRRESAGVVSRQAEEILKSFTNQMKILWNNIRMVGIEIGETLMPTLMLMADGLREIIIWWRSLDLWVKQLSVHVLTFAGLIGPAILLVGSFTRMVIGLFASFGTMFILMPIRLVLGLLNSLIMGTAYYLGVIAGSLVSVLTTMGAISLISNALLLGFGGLFIYAAIEPMKKAFGEIASTFLDTWNGIKDAMAAGDMELAFRIGTTGIKIAWLQMIDGLKEAWADFVEAFKLDWGSVLRTISFGVYQNTPNPRERDIRRLQDTENRLMGSIFSRFMGQAAEGRRMGLADQTPQIQQILQDLRQSIPAQGTPGFATSRAPAMAQRLWSRLNEFGTFARYLEALHDQRPVVQEFPAGMRFLQSRIIEQNEMLEMMRLSAAGAPRPAGPMTEIERLQVELQGLIRTAADRANMTRFNQQSPGVAQAVSLIGSAFGPLQNTLGVVGAQLRDMAPGSRLRGIPGAEFEFPEGGRQMGEFQQISLRRFDLEGPGGLANAPPTRRTQVHDERTHQLLEQLRDRPRNPVVRP